MCVHFSMFSLAISPWPHDFLPCDVVDILTCLLLPLFSTIQSCCQCFCELYVTIMIAIKCRTLISLLCDLHCMITWIIICLFYYVYIHVQYSREKILFTQWTKQKDQLDICCVWGEWLRKAGNVKESQENTRSVYQLNSHTNLYVCTYVCVCIMYVHTVCSAYNIHFNQLHSCCIVLQVIIFSHLWVLAITSYID